MQRSARRCLITMMLLSGWTLAPSAVTASLRGSMHDFSMASGADTQYRDTTGTVWLCGTCHVGAHRGPGSGAPGWNHTLSTVTYSWSEVTTLAGTTLPTALNALTAGSSKACLSCHDGSVAVGSVQQGASWDTKKITGASKITGSGNADLSGNHPVGVPYPDQQDALYNGITTKGRPAEFKASPTMARIYGSTGGKRGIECGSCHDPHDSTTGGGKFMRVDQNVLCVDCHTK